MDQMRGSGTLTFGAVMISLAGSFNVLHGIVAVVNPDYFGGDLGLVFIVLERSSSSSARPCSAVAGSPMTRSRTARARPPRLWRQGKDGLQHALIDSLSRAVSSIRSQWQTKP
jgi:hypothetical protein